MSAVLEPGKKLRRIIKVYGVEQPVVVEITTVGITFKVKGTKIPVGNNWVELIEEGCHTEDAVKSYLAGKPLEFLKYQATELTKRAVKRLDKKENA